APAEFIDMHPAEFRPGLRPGRDDVIRRALGRVGFRGLLTRQTDKAATCQHGQHRHRPAGPPPRRTALLHDPPLLINPDNLTKPESSWMVPESLRGDNPRGSRARARKSRGRPAELAPWTPLWDTSPPPRAAGGTARLNRAAGHQPEQEVTLGVGHVG